MVKWFVEEERSAEVERFRRDATAAVSQLTQLVSALARRHREGAIAAEALKDLVTTSTEALDSVLVVGLSEAVSNRARDLLLRQPLRAADAIQLASCLDLQEQLQQTVRFLAFDQPARLARLPQRGLPAAGGRGGGQPRRQRQDGGGARCRSVG